MRRLLPLLLALLTAAPAAAAPVDLVALLRQGGLVIFLRHAETGPPNPDQATAVIGDCATQRSLNATGRAQAVAIGEAFRALDLPVARVLASPFCRTLETAVLALGRGEPDWALALPRHVDAEAHQAMGQALLGLLSQAPAPGGGNLVLVGHSYHLIAAGGPRPDPQGAAAVLQPDGQGGFRVLALLPPAAWTALARTTLAALPAQDDHATPPVVTR